MTQSNKVRANLFLPPHAPFARHPASGEAPQSIGGVVSAAVEAWFLGGPVDGRLMPVEVTADGSPPAVVKLPQSGFYVGAGDVPPPAVEHVYVLADRIDDLDVYQYRQPASEAAD